MNSRRLVGAGIAVALLIGVGVGVMFGSGGRREDSVPLAVVADGAVTLPESPPAAASAAPRASAVIASPPRPRAAPSKAWCTPPYTYDANGRKHYKRECLP